MKKQFNRLSHSIWLCKYHIIFCPKYRYKILTGTVEVSLRNILYSLASQKKLTIEEINILPDHVHMIISIPPKYAISDTMGFLKGRSSIKLFQQFPHLQKRYWGGHIWSRGYCVSSVGMDEEMIRKYVKWQQEQNQKG